MVVGIMVAPEQGDHLLRSGSQGRVLDGPPGHLIEPPSVEERDLAGPRLPQGDLSRVQELVDLVGERLAVLAELFDHDDRDVRFNEGAIEVDEHAERGTVVTASPHLGAGAQNGGGRPGEGAPGGRRRFP